jgi:hypothetical protein
MRHPFRKPSVILSLILLAACVVFWHRGNRQRETMSYNSESRHQRAEISSTDGDIVAAWEETPGPLVWFSPVESRSDKPAAGFSLTTGAATEYLIPLFGANHSYGWAGFQTVIGTGYWIVHIPCWALIALFCIRPMFAVRQWALLRKRARLNLCIHCGYDLRFSKDRCPECGTAITAPTTEPVASEPSVTTG